MDIKRPHRRHVLSLLGGAAAVGVSGRAFAQAEPPKPAQIVVNHSGGSMGTAMRKAFFNGFEKKYGIRVIETSPVDFGKLRAMVDSGNVEWDLTEIGGQDAIRASKLDLLDKVDPKVVDRSKYPPTAQNPHVFASSVYTTIIGYRTDVFKGGTHPKSWAEWWDVKKFPGARSMRNHPTDNLEFALIADGVPKDKVYPIDFDRAFKKLDQIKPHVTAWWSTGQQPAQLLLDKEVVLATGWNGRFYDVIKKGGPIEIEWNEGALKQGSFAIPRGAKNPYWANKMLAELAIPQQQAVYASELGYPGLNLESLNFVDAKVKPYLPTAYLDKQFWISDAWYAENGAKAQELWNAWMLKKAEAALRTGEESGEGSAELLVEGVAKRFGDVVALDHVSLQVAQGELLTILGPSGSGKTTLLKVVAGFETPDAGRVTVGGADITALPPAKRDIGMVFQNYALFPHLSVKANVAFPLEMRNVGRTEIDRRVGEALAMVELAGYEARLPKQLSGGQQQRVALARAIVFNPRLLLLDEPFGALDRKLRETMQLEVRRLQRRLGLTTIFITHDQEEALVLSDRIAVMNKGAIQQIATTTEIYERPANDFVADFVGESNILHGTMSAPGLVALPDGRKLMVDSEAAPGAKVGVLMRPERFAPGGINEFTGEIVEAVYLGTSFKLRLTCEGGQELLVRQPARGPLPAAGTTITVGIDPEAIHVF